MSNFIYDATTLPNWPKANFALRADVPVTKKVTADDWNTSNQALMDLQGFARGAKWIGITEQAVDPAPAGVAKYLWPSTDGFIHAVTTLGAITLGLKNTATPGSYTNASITVDANGRITSVSTGGSSGMAIGGTVTSATAGSILFAATGPVLAQNNADLNWDNTNFTLGITGGNNTHFALDIHELDTSGSQNGVRIANNAGSFGLATLQFDNASTLVGTIIGSNSVTSGLVNGLTLTVPAGKMMGVRQGAAVTASLILQVDATNSFLNVTNFSLGHTNTSVYQLDLQQSATIPIFRMKNTNVNGYTAIQFDDSSSTQRGGIGFGNASASNGWLVGVNYLYSAANDNWVMGNTTIAVHTFGMTAGSAFHAMTDGASAAVSAANTGRLRYNNSTHTFQVSLNTGAYTDLVTGAASGMSIGGTVTSATAGSILFAATGPVLAQDNTNFFWDNTNKRLGIGTNSLSFAMEIFQSINASALVRFKNSSSSGYSALLFADSGGTERGDVGYANASVGLTHLQSCNYLYANGANWVMGTSSARGFTFDMTNFRLGVNTGTTALDMNEIRDSVSATEVFRLRNTNSAGGSGMQMQNDSGTFKFSIGYANASNAISYIASQNYIYSGGPNFVMANGTRAEFTYGMTDGSTFLEMADGASAAVSAANTMRLRWNNGTGKLQISKSGAAYVDVI